MGKRKTYESRLDGLNMIALAELIESGKYYGYKEFCTNLGIKPLKSGSDSQIRQLNELDMICEYEKFKTKYKFIRLRNENEIILHKERSIFTPLIEFCLSEKFLEAKNEDKQNYKDGLLYFSISQLLLWCGMVHENYNFIRNNHEKEVICAKHEFEIEELLKFLNISYDNVLKPIIRNALKTMDNKKSIVIHKAFKVFTISDNGFKVFKNVLSTSDIGKQLENIVADVYTEFGIKKVQELFYTSYDYRKKIYDRCDEVCKQKLGYDGFYDCYAIIINENRLKHNLIDLQKELNIRTQKRLLTTKQLESIPKNSKERFIGSMIDLESKEDFKRDLEEFSKYKIGL